MEAKISIDGLSEFNRGLRQLDKEVPKGLRLALNDAADLLIDRIRPTVPSLTGAARKSLKAKSTRTSARVSVGGKKAPYFPWLDFGGRTGRKKANVRPFLKEGRYVYPTLKKVRPEIEDKLGDALKAVARNAGLDVD